MEPASATRAVVLDCIVRSRTSVRAFRPDPVDKEVLTEIFETARFSPSTFNTQPWRAYLLTGNVKLLLSDAISRSHHSGDLPVFSPFPNPSPEEVVARHSEFGRRFLTALGIDRNDTVTRGRLVGRNFLFYDAPVGIIFTIESSLTKHSWLDFGIFLQTLMLAAQSHGLATCPQVAFVRFQSIISDQLQLQPAECVVCGMSLGYSVDDAPVNNIEMPREPLGNFTRWLGF